MTRDTSYIGRIRQFRFWLLCRLGLKRAEVFLGFCCENDPIAYGIVWEGYLVSGGLSKTHRGQGLGKDLFRFLGGRCHRTPFLEVRRGNYPAVYTYQELGWRIVRQTKYILYMELMSDGTQEVAPQAPRPKRAPSPQAP